MQILPNHTNEHIDVRCNRVLYRVFVASKQKLFLERLQFRDDSNQDLLAHKMCEFVETDISILIDVCEELRLDPPNTINEEEEDV